MINVSSSVVSGTNNRPVTPQSYVSGQATLGSAVQKPFIPTGLKVADSTEVSQPVKADSVALDDAVKKINSFIATSSASVQFSVDTDTNRTVVKVVDLETKQVIRQFPNEDVLAMSKALDKLQGLMVKQTA